MMSRHKSSPWRVKEAYDEVALLEMEEAEYLELLRRAKPLAVHPTWQAYRAWMKDFIEKDLIAQRLSITFSDLNLGVDLRVEREERWRALLRARNGWQQLLR